MLLESVGEQFHVYADRDIIFPLLAYPCTVMLGCKKGIVEVQLANYHLKYLQKGERNGLPSQKAKLSLDLFEIILLDCSLQQTHIVVILLLLLENTDSTVLTHLHVVNEAVSIVDPRRFLLRVCAPHSLI